MGASSSCNIFEKLSCALQWCMLNKYDAASMSHILDDFFFIGPPHSQKCSNDLQTFLEMCNRINIPINNNKTIEPTSMLTIYGIEVDSVAMESRLPQDKVHKKRVC